MKQQSKLNSCLILKSAISALQVRYANYRKEVEYLRVKVDEIKNEIEAQENGNAE